MLTMKPTTIVMFTYRGEEELLPVTLARAVRTIPYASVHIFDDEKDPLPDALIVSLKSDARVHYSTTTFNRGVNLNGAESIRGQLACMQEAAERDGNKDGIVIKMDPDTLLLRPEFIIQAFDEGQEAVMGTSDKGVFSGMFYAMSRRVLDEVKANADVMTFAKDSPEDLAIGSLVYIAVAAKEPKVRWVNAFLSEERKFMAAFDVRKVGTDKYAREIEYVATYGRIITVGNTGIYGLPKSYRTQAARDLCRICDVVEQQEQMQRMQDALKKQMERQHAAQVAKEVPNTTSGEQPIRVKTVDNRRYPDEIVVDPDGIEVVE